jgi:hypothetical protein
VRSSWLVLCAFRIGASSRFCCFAIYGTIWQLAKQVCVLRNLRTEDRSADEVSSPTCRSGGADADAAVRRQMSVERVIASFASSSASRAVKAACIRVLMKSILPTFLARHPGVNLDIVTEGKLVDIVAGGFDAGIRLGEATPRTPDEEFTA